MNPITPKIFPRCVQKHAWPSSILSMSNWENEALKPSPPSKKTVVICVTLSSRALDIVMLPAASPESECFFCSCSSPLNDCSGVLRHHKLIHGVENLDCSVGWPEQRCLSLL